MQFKNAAKNCCLFVALLPIYEESGLNVGSLSLPLSLCLSVSVSISLISLCLSVSLYVSLSVALSLSLSHFAKMINTNDKRNTCS